MKTLIDNGWIDGSVKGIVLRISLGGKATKLREARKARPPSTVSLPSPPPPVSSSPARTAAGRGRCLRDRHAEQHAAGTARTA
jgi:hypothetical protein